MTQSTCPSCGSPRAGVQRFCPQCAFDYWKAAVEAPTQHPTAPVAPATTGNGKKSSVPTILGAVIVLAVIVGVGYVAINQAGENLLDDVANDLGGGDSSADLPPEGAVWFGNSFDTDTFEIRQRLQSVSTTETFAMVASLSRVMDADEINMRVFWDGQAVSNAGINATGSGDLWGFTAGPLFSAGEWRYEFTDIGGNVLASGEIRATE